jgi:hypothetical protein
MMPEAGGEEKNNTEKKNQNRHLQFKKYYSYQNDVPVIQGIFTYIFIQKTGSEFMFVK